MLKVSVFGSSGRMGQTLKKLIEQSSDLQWVGGASHEDLNPTLTETPELIVDFSLPEAQEHLIPFAEKYGAAVVSGTTGMGETHFDQLKKLGQSVPVFWAANMSFGVYLMTLLSQTLAQYDAFYKLHVEETHHVHKKDKPSGTALLIEDAVRQKSDQLQETISIREGEVFGIHRLIAKGANESLEIRHEAFNRELFAQGALEIGQWVVQQKPGYYQMPDFFRQFQVGH